MTIPEPGQIVQTFLAHDISPYTTAEATFHKVTLESLEDHSLVLLLRLSGSFKSFLWFFLLLADDVGLGKTVEAGSMCVCFALQESLLS